MTWRDVSDAALEAAASRGLLRRAERDVAAGLARLRSQDETRAEVEVDGAVVTLVPEGVGAARCTCPSREVCRHTLAAALLLRGLAAENGPATVAAPADPLAEIAALSEAAITKALGRTAVRDGARLLAASGPAEVTVEGAACRIRIPGQPDVLFFAGSGLAGMACKAPAARAKALHAAALRAVRGSAAEPEGAVATGAAAVAPDGAFLEQVRGALLDAARSALGSAPRALEDRLFDLAVSSRADSLPALAAMLRQAADRVAARRERDPAFDPAAALATLARAFALTEALGSHAADALRGVVRQTFEPFPEPLDLVGCGVDVWRAEAGARGATAHLYSPKLDRWFSATQARAAGQDPGYSPVRTAQTGGAVWGQHLATVGRSRVRLTGAEVSSGGRLSLGQRTRAELAPLAVTQDEIETWPAVFSDWDRLLAALGGWFDPSLHASGRTTLPLILWPVAFGRTQFDDAAQRLVLPARDMQGRWLGLTVDHDDAHPQRAQAVEALSARPVPTVQLVFATATVDGGRYAVQPYAANGEAGAPVSFALEPSKELTTAEPARAVWASAPTATDRLLAAVQDGMVGFCELGGRLQDPGRAARLATLARRAEESGLEPLGRILAGVAAEDPRARAAAILAAVHTAASLSALTRRLPMLAIG